MESYTTPEGFELHRPLLLPDARSFADVLEYLGEYDIHGPREEGIQAGARLLAAGGPGAAFVRDVAALGGLPEDDAGARNVIGPYCRIDLSQLGGPKFRSVRARATDAVMAAVADRIVTPDDHLSFQLIAHEASGRVLVILGHSYIIGSHYLAYIDPATIPAYPYAARDARYRDLCDSLRDAGRQPYVDHRPGGVIHVRNVPDALPPVSATIAADGTAELVWPDGSTSR